MESFEIDGYFFLKEDKTFTSFSQSSNCEFISYRDVTNTLKIVNDPMANTWEACIINNDSIFGYGKTYQEAYNSLKESEIFISEIKNLI